MKKRFPIIPELDPEMDELRKQTQKPGKRTGSNAGRKRKKRKSATGFNTMTAGRRVNNGRTRKSGRTL